jgi:hypothetical protein
MLLGSAVSRGTSANVAREREPTPPPSSPARPDQQRRRASPAWLLTQGGCCTNKRRWHSRTTPRIGDATGALLRAAGAYTRLICCPGRDRNWTPITTAFRCGGFVQQPRRRSGSRRAPTARPAVDCWIAPAAAVSSSAPRQPLSCLQLGPPPIWGLDPGILRVMAFSGASPAVAPLHRVRAGRVPTGTALMKSRTPVCVD